MKLSPRRLFALGVGAFAVAGVLLAAACGADEPEEPEVVATLTPAEVVAADLQVLFTQGNRGLNPERIERVGRSGDARHAWLIADLMRFYPENDTRQQLQAAWHEIGRAHV